MLYKKIATILAGNAAGVLNYIYTDRNLSTGGTMLYYRLKAVDQGAAYLYSGVVALRNEEEGSSLQVLSNPIGSSLRWNLTTNRRGKVFAVLYAANGTVARQGSYSMNGPVLREAFLTSELPQGTYILEVRLNDRRWNQKLIKQ